MSSSSSSSSSYSGSGAGSGDLGLPPATDDDGMRGEVTGEVNAEGGSGEVVVDAVGVGSCEPRRNGGRVIDGAAPVEVLMIGDC